MESTFQSLPTSPDAMASAQPFSLLNLPLELMDIILIKCIRMGSLGIMRTCHRIYDRASSFLAEHAFFHLNIQVPAHGEDFAIAYATYDPPTFPTQLAAMAQYVEIVLSRTISTTARQFPPFTDSAGLNMLGTLCHPKHQPKNCHVVLIYGTGGDFSGLGDFFDYVKCFEVVTVEAMCIGTPSFTVWPAKRGPTPTTRNAYVLNVISWCYTDLGYPSAHRVAGKAVDEECLLYHPETNWRNLTKQELEKFLLSCISAEGRLPSNTRIRS